MVNQSESGRTKKSKPIAVAYLRVSTSSQGEDGFSIDNQRRSAIEYAAKMGFDLSNDLIFIEEKPASQYSGYTVDMTNIIDNFKRRPKLIEIIKLAEKRLFQHLIVYSRDRLAREAQDATALELFFYKYLINVHFTREGEAFDGLNPNIKNLLSIVFNSISEMEVSILSNRVRDGLKECALKGKWTGGKVPFGFVPLRDKDESKTKKKWTTKLAVSDFESIMVKKVFDLYASGLGYRNIAKVMNKEYSFIEWTKSKVEGIIKNETYTGRLIWDRRGGRRAQGKRNITPIVSQIKESNIIVEKDLWEGVKLERAARDERKDKCYYNTKYILKDKVLCPTCNQLMKIKNPGSGKTIVYHCYNNSTNSSCHTNIPCHLVEKAFIDELRSNDLKDYGTQEILETLSVKLSERICKNEEFVDELDKRIADVNEIIIKIDNKRKELKDKELINALSLQYLINNNYKEKYIQSKLGFEQKIEIDKLARNNLERVVLPFISVLFNNTSQDDVSGVWREFVINFINKVNISYDKTTKTVKIDLIDFLPS
jgi:site-specific DNA recombinase